MPNLLDVRYTAGSVNTGGMLNILIIDRDDILTLADDVNGVVSTAITLNAGKRFYSIYATLDKNSLGSKRQGEKDGGSFVNTLTFVSPSNQQDLIDISGKVVNGGYIVLAQEMDASASSNYRLLGNLLRPAYLTDFEQTTGANSSDFKMTSFTFSAVGQKPAVIYSGGISGLVFSSPIATVASSVTATTMTANWTAVSGATGYRLDVSTSPVFASFVGAYSNFAVASTSQAITGLTTATTYYFRVRAEKSGITSGDSNVVTQATI